MALRVALLCVQADYPGRNPAPPYGLLAAAQSLRDAGHEVVLQHLFWRPGSELDLLSACSNADAVGLSVMAGPDLAAAVGASRTLEHAGHFVFWGGAYPSIVPEIALSEPSVSAVLRGEAESNLVAFCEWREGLQHASQVPGLCYRSRSGRSIVSDLPDDCSASCLAGFSLDLMDVPWYIRTDGCHSWANQEHVKALPYVTSVGCSFRCKFCFNSVLHRSGWRGRPLATVWGEMDYLVREHGVSGWYLYDDCFFGDQERAWHLLKRINAPSFVQVTSDLMSEGFVQRLLSHNVARVYFGGESGSDRILRLIGKGHTASQTMEIAKRCSRLGLPVEISFMVFLPTETPDELRKTLLLMQRLEDLPSVHVDGPKVFQPLPGTPLHSAMVDQGWSPPVSNQEWAVFTRNVSPVIVGYEVTEAHLRVLNEFGYAINDRGVVARVQD